MLNYQRIHLTVYDMHRESGSIVQNLSLHPSTGTDAMQRRQ